MQKKCLNCGKEIAGDILFCPECGACIIKDFREKQADDPVRDFFDKKEKRDSRRVAVIITTVIVAVIIALVVLLIVYAGNSFSLPSNPTSGTATQVNSEFAEVENILKTRGYKQAKVVSAAKLKAVEGLDNNSTNIITLLSNGTNYAIVIVDKDNQKVVDGFMGFAPLNAVTRMVFETMDEDFNIKYMNAIGVCLEDYGINSLGSEEDSVAEDFLRKISGQDGLVDTAKARDAVSGCTTRIFPNISSADQVTVLFEKGNAVPAYYATQSVTQVFNWPIMEEDYEKWQVYDVDVDMDLLIRSWGPPYVEKTVWAVVDSNLNEVGLYNSLAEAKEKLYIEE